MKTLIALLLLTVGALAQTTVDVAFKWDTNPATDNVTEYRIYELVDGTAVLRTSTAETTGAVTGVVLDQDRTFVCRAVNAAAESGDSNAVVLDHKVIVAELSPGVPVNFGRAKITITIELQ